MPSTTAQNEEINGIFDETENCHTTSPEEQPKPVHFILVTDGPVSLRLLFHPEVTNKSIDLTEMPYFYRYVDLIKVFTHFYSPTNEAIENVVDILKCEFLSLCPTDSHAVNDP